jgi:hypothetical protein
MSKEMMGEKQNISSFNIQAWNQKNKRGLLSGGSERRKIFRQRSGETSEEITETKCDVQQEFDNGP